MSRDKIKEEKAFFTKTVKRSGRCWPRISLPLFFVICTGIWKYTARASYSRKEGGNGENAT
jgi:hypothetical protein